MGIAYNLFPFNFLLYDLLSITTKTKALRLSIYNYFNTIEAKNKLRKQIKRKSNKQIVLIYRDILTGGSIFGIIGLKTVPHSLL
jgi:hypoxanthine-guanine phosphoribosyltransferase